MGAATKNGKVRGCYLHGLFSNDGFRNSYLRQLGAKPGSLDYGQSVEDTLDDLAQHIEKHIDLTALLELAGTV